LDFILFIQSNITYNKKKRKEIQDESRWQWIKSCLGRRV